VVGERRLAPALLPVWEAVHRRMSSGRPVTRVRVGPLDEAGRAAVADLLGLERLPGAHADLRVAVLDEVLRAAVGADLLTVVEEMLGPIGNRAGERQRQEAERAALWTWFAAHPVVAAQAALAGWVAAVRSAGLIGGSVDRTRDELDRALLVLAHLPSSGEPLPVLAARLLGDPHALDEPTRSAGLVLRALAILHDVPPPVDAQARRELWERFGVATDELSSTVLAAGFRITGDGLVETLLRACAEAGQGAVLTLSQLRSTGPWRNLPGDVRVVENPALMALALREFGSRCPPLVCIAGWPSAAGILLLQRLAAAGARLWYHGDFDGDGLRIAANVVARTGARPWRMTTDDYLSALGEPPVGPLVGRVTAVPWDATLATEMIRVGVAVPEEKVAPTLLRELRE
jgi:uncharacterized protein (TIGR02679 family)